MFWRKIRKVSRVTGKKKICSLFLCILFVCLISAQYFTNINQNKAQAAVPKIVKYIPLYFGESSTETGYETLDTTTSTSYVIPSRSNIISWDATKYNGTVAVYFEAVIMTSNASGVATAALTLGGGTTAITGSPVTTSATTFTRVRSGDISGNLSGSPTNYECIIKTNNASYTTTICNARLVVTQSGTITKTETYIPFGWAARTNTQTSYASPRTPSVGTIEALSLYTAANWSNVANIYFETNLKTSNASYTASACLYTAAGAAVTNGAVTTTSTSKTRLRTAALTLVDGTGYKEWAKMSSASGTGTVNGGVIIIQQSGAITATETHMSTSGDVFDATNPTGSLRYALYLYTASDWSVASMAVYGEGTMAVDPNTYTGTMYSMNGSTAATTDTEAGTTPARHRSASWSPTNGNLLDQRVSCWGSGSHIHFAGGKIIFVVTLNTFTQKQENWHWYNDNANVPPLDGNSLANENVAPSAVTSSMVLRLRISIQATGGADQSAASVRKLQYSTDQANWYDVGAQGSGTIWRYYNGPATDGASVSAPYKLALTPTVTTGGLYLESNTPTYQLLANAVAEFEYTIQANSSSKPDAANYYFRLYDTTASAEVAKDSGKNYPSLSYSFEGDLTLSAQNVTWSGVNPDNPPNNTGKGLTCTINTNGSWSVTITTSSGDAQGRLWCTANSLYYNGTFTYTSSGSAGPTYQTSPTSFTTSGTNFANYATKVSSFGMSSAYALGTPTWATKTGSYTATHTYTLMAL